MEKSSHLIKELEKLSETLGNNELKKLTEEISQEFETVSKEYNNLQKFNQQTLKYIRFYRQVLNELPNPIFIKDKFARYLFFNKAYKNFFKMSSEKYLNKNVLDLDYIPLSDRQKYHKENLSAIENESAIQYERQLSLSDDNTATTLYWIKGFHVKGTDEKGLVGEIIDISHEKKLKKNLEMTIKEVTKSKKIIEENAITDSLTNLYNRRVLSSVIAEISSSEDNVYLLLADLDHFKNVNDTFGHLVGDDILMKFSSVLKASCRSKDVIIRYGGEEFLIILKDVKMLEALNIAERIRTSSMSNILLPDNECVTVSIGVSVLKSNIDFMKNVDNADKALYLAKRRGRNRVEYV